MNVNSNTQPNKIPTSISLTLSYYQMDQVRKKLVSSSIEFSGFVSPSEIKADIYNYTLNINYLPLSHTDLMIAFALPWYVYLTMYLIVGIMAVFMTAIFAGYHKLMARFKKTSIHFMGYFRYYLPSPMKGYLIIVFPLLLYILFISIFFTFHLMQFQIPSLWCTSKDTKCLESNIWNSLTAYPDLPDKEKTTLVNSRLGFIFIHTGLWLMWRNSQLMTLQPSKTEQKGIFVGYDKNCWYTTAWQRMNYFTFNILTVIMEVFFVHASFSTLFSNNLWYFIASFKVIGIIVENAGEVLLSNNLMLAPISSTIDMMENLVTFGATDFLQFLSSFILGLGVQMAERAYVEPLIDQVVDKIVENRQKIVTYLSNMLGESKPEEELEDEQEEDPEPEEQIEEQIGEKNDGSPQKENPNNPEAKEPDQLSRVDSQGSDILLTENSAANEAGDIFNHMHPQLMIEAAEEDSEEDEKSFLIDARNSKIPIKERINKILDEVFKKIHHNPYSQQEDDFEQIFKQKEIELEKMKGSKRLEEEKNKEKEEGKENEVDSDANIETYYNYCVRTISMLYFPLVTVIIWQFYSETAFSSKWSIKQKDFLFYFLFAIIIIPFQIIIDVLFYNLMSYLYEYDYLGSLKKWNLGTFG